MPYIRQIDGHATEARRQKLDPVITKIVDELLSQNDVDVNAALFEFTILVCEEWSKPFTARQGKIRYYNFNDIDGVVISAIFEMMRRLNFYNQTFPHWSSLIIKDSEKKRARMPRMRELAQSLTALFDTDRGEAAGECNYSLSEIALGLINANKLSTNEVVQDMYAGVQYYYNQEPATYEDASITDPEKGDTKGYTEYLKKHP